MERRDPSPRATRPLHLCEPPVAVAAMPPTLEVRTRIDPLTLRLFIAVMDTGTIAAAGEREHLAPSAVSKRLSDLEDFLGTPLLRRSNRGIVPTAAGTELLGLARSVLHDLDDIYLRLKEHAQGARGLVRVFANITAIAVHMPDALRSFLARYPRVQVQMSERTSDGVMQAVAANAADVGICVYEGGHADGLDWLPYRHDELVVVAPADHPLARRGTVTIAEALGHDFVGLHTGSYINQSLERASREHGVPLRLRLQVTSYDALGLMVEAGMGLALMPRSLAQRFGRLAGIASITLDQRWARRELRICVRSDEPLPVAARLFVDHLRDVDASSRTASGAPSSLTMAAS